MYNVFKQLILLELFVKKDDFSFVSFYILCFNKMPSQSDNKDFDVKSEICYISANCNRKPHAFDLRSDVILYPSANSVCLYNLQAHRHVQVLNYHTNQVNRVRWIRSGRVTKIYIN